MTDDPKRTPNAPFHPPGVGRYPAVDDRLTTKVEAAPSWAISMQESINKQFSSVNAHLDLQDSAFDGLQVRVGVLEAAQAKRSTGPQQSYSGPIRALQAGQDRTSQNDLRQDSELAETREWREKTDKRLDAQDEAIATAADAAVAAKGNTEIIKSAVTGVSGFLKQHPQFSTSIATLLGLIIALATQWFQAKVHP